MHQHPPMSRHVAFENSDSTFLPPMWFNHGGAVGGGGGGGVAADGQQQPHLSGSTFLDLEAHLRLSEKMRVDAEREAKSLRAKLEQRDEVCSLLCCQCC